MIRTWFASSLVLLAIVAVPASVSAQDRAPLGDRINAEVTPATLSVQPAPVRGPVLPALYISLAAFNVYDGYSTSAALKRGAVEKNPLMSGAAGSQVSLWIVKGATTGAAIYVAERLWKQHHRGAAVALMVASNGIMAGVAMHNSSVLATLK